MRPTPAQLTTEAVARQLDALDAPDGYEIGLRLEGKEGMLHRKADRAGVLAMVPFLRAQNAKREHIYVRPLHTGRSALVLVDDWTLNMLSGASFSGIKPACALTTSPGNVQAWIKLPEAVDDATRKAIARCLVRRHGGDVASADGLHYGRLVGFTNVKDKHRNAKGLHPFAKLLSSTGEALASDVYAPLLEGAQELLAEVEQANALARAAVRSRGASLNDVAVRTSFALAAGHEFDEPSNTGLTRWFALTWDAVASQCAGPFGDYDRSHIDWRCCVMALRHGHSPGDVEQALYGGSPELATQRKAGHAHDYTLRTVWKAVAWLDAERRGQSWEEVGHTLLARARELQRQAAGAAETR